VLSQKITIKKSQSKNHNQNVNTKMCQHKNMSTQEYANTKNIDTKICRHENMSTQKMSTRKMSTRQKVE
jgi:hypothetical protein